jgi:hypothetical protein
MTSRQDKRTPDRIIEEALGELARGLFRANQAYGPHEAAALADAALKTVRGMWLDFERQKAGKELGGA